MKLAKYQFHLFADVIRPPEKTKSRALGRRRNSSFSACKVYFSSLILFNMSGGARLYIGRLAPDVR